MPGKEDYGNVCVCVFGATRNNCVDILIHQLERRRWLRVVLEEERGTQRRPSCIMQMSDEADEIWVIDWLSAHSSFTEDKEEEEAEEVEEGNDEDGRQKNQQCEGDQCDRNACSSLFMHRSRINKSTFIRMSEYYVQVNRESYVYELKEKERAILGWSQKAAERRRQGLDEETHCASDGKRAVWGRDTLRKISGLLEFHKKGFVHVGVVSVHSNAPYSYWQYSGSRFCYPVLYVVSESLSLKGRRRSRVCEFDKQRGLFSWAPENCISRVLSENPIIVRVICKREREREREKEREEEEEEEEELSTAAVFYLMMRGWECAYMVMIMHHSVELRCWFLWFLHSACVWHYISSNI